MTPSSEDAPTTEAAIAEACSNCGSVLAADQRYCLNCGDRRAEARLDFIDILSEDASDRATTAVLPTAAVAAGSEKTGAEGWVRNHAGILSLAAVLLLTLATGTVLGSVLDGSGSSNSKAAKPQVIKVEGAAGSSGDSAATDSGAAADDSASSASSSGTDKAEKGGSGSTKGVQSADSKSKKDIEKSVDKGEPLSTGDGDLPQTDDKAAGGGSDFQTIQ